MVVTASPEATGVGLQVLRSGGNAVDAAVAVGFALAVTYPSAGNIGGGAFILIRMADGREAAIDARETAPARAHAAMYLDSAGKVIPDASKLGPSAAGVPGSVDGLLSALESFGTFSRAEVMKPAIGLAREGFVLSPAMTRLFYRMQPHFRKFPSSLRVYSKQGAPYRSGERFRQPDLAGSLERIAAGGRGGFYSGRTADMIVRSMRSSGIITHQDLAEYHSIVRKPLKGEYLGYEVLTMPPPSAGGVTLLQLFNIIGDEDAKGGDDPDSLHRIVEAMRLSFADRWKFMGDPAFTDIPTDSLISRSCGKLMKQRIDSKRAAPARDLAPGFTPHLEGVNTTHYSIVDRWGNAVSVTTTLNDVCGGKFVVDGAGFLLNNEMDDFSVSPGMPNLYGLPGSHANSIAPRKRMTSSMTPAIFIKQGQVHLIIGSPGGSRIPTTVFQVCRNILAGKMALDKALAAPRIHHQWFPDSLYYEQGALTDAQRTALAASGHSPVVSVPFGRVDAVSYNGTLRMYEGCSDPRGQGAAGGY